MKAAAVRVSMELYYKDLISEDTSLEKLVEDLMLVVQGADEFVEAAGANLGEEPRAEITTRLERLKANCRSLKRHARSSALATDKVLHQYPYSFAGFAFAAGLMIGALTYRNLAKR
jgi:ElaB/YqjD/DUF883 family membrane-anchored ribosome-binding protein